jgi:hypothetical protein
MELVAYRQVPGANVVYRFSRFPLSLGQPLHSMVRVLREASREPLEAAVSRQVISFADRRLYFEDLLDRTAIAHAGDPAHFSHVQRNLANALVSDLRHLLVAQDRRLRQKVERLGAFEGAQEIQHLLGRTLQLARIATERADEVLQDRGARRLRALFTELVDEYGRIGAWRMWRPEIEAYLQRFQVFEAAVGHEFSDRKEMRLAQPAALRCALQRGIGYGH